ncbi:MAG: hypothetical protein Q9223_003060 [Gallowayella weberi]
MEQAGILGNLMKYDEFTYSKMLTQGYKFGSIEAEASTAILECKNTHGQNNSKNQQQYISQLNKSFRQQRWDIKLDQYDSDTVWELEDHLDTALECARQLGPSHGPYFLIGNAAGIFLNGLSDDDALNRIQKINITFSSAEVKEHALLNILKDILARTDRTNLNHPNVLTLLKRKLQACHDHRVILFLCATPKGLRRLNVGREYETLKETISASHLGDGYRVESVHSCRLQDITKALRTYKPTILHFSGHADASSLAFEDGSGDDSPIELSRLVDVMKQGAANNLRCVLLNACATAEQSSCIANEVGTVIAMKDAVGDDAAITFTQVFYNALAAGHTVDNAFAWARPEVKLLHKDSIYPQIIKGGTSSNSSSDLVKRTTPQAKNEMSGLASLEPGLKTLQIEDAQTKLVRAEKSARESADEDEACTGLDKNEPVFWGSSPTNVGLSSSATSTPNAPGIVGSAGSEAEPPTSTVPPKSDASMKAVDIPPLSEKSITNSVSAMNPNNTSPVAAENKIADPKSSSTQSVVQVANVQKPQQKYIPTIVDIQGSPRPSAAKKQDGGSLPAAKRASRDWHKPASQYIYFSTDNGLYDNTSQGFVGRTSIKTTARNFTFTSPFRKICTGIVSFPRPSIA